MSNIRHHPLSRPNPAHQRTSAQSAGSGWHSMFYFYRFALSNYLLHFRRTKTSNAPEPKNPHRQTHAEPLNIYIRTTGGVRGWLVSKICVRLASRHRIQKPNPWVRWNGVGVIVIVYIPGIVRVSLALFLSRVTFIVVAGSNGWARCGVWFEFLAKGVAHCYILVYSLYIYAHVT